MRGIFTTNCIGKIIKMQSNTPTRYLYTRVFMQLGVWRGRYSYALGTLESLVINHYFYTIK